MEEGKNVEYLLLLRMHASRSPADTNGRDQDESEAEKALGLIRSS